MFTMLDLSIARQLTEKSYTFPLKDFSTDSTVSKVSKLNWKIDIFIIDL